MRRRRKGNPLLMRIIGISVLAHLILLPVLAHFGAFKKIQQHFVEAQMVVLPLPPEKVKPEVKKMPRAAPKQQAARKSAAPAAHPHSAAAKSNLNQPKVVAAGPGGSGDGGGSTVDPNGNGAVGVVPSVKSENKPPERPVEPVKPAETEKPAVKPVETVVKPAETVKPVEKPVKVEPVKPIEPIKPKIPVFAEAEPMPGQQPQPTIPDELRAEALDKTCVVEFTVGPDGAPTSVKITASTSVQELDRLALDAARRWRFKPATRDGQPVESQVRLHIEFQVI